MVVVQPCGLDRVPHGSPVCVGPVRDPGDTRILRAWLERGEWPHEGESAPE